ncbi:MAG: tRNA pseudouridine(38-40) synthase TruA [Candidatus Omnitrophica bacterium]|nr:tRNA pseudouridine(38-40) synthase TruA [Candidatus Omnitrophota bacterium]
MRNIFIETEYLGTNYFGFQVQNKKNSFENTVQKEIEGAINRLFKQDIRLIYSSRTDKGVHALGHCANFKITTNIPLKNIKRALNSFLPEDIRIKKVRSMPLDFHARFSVKSKIYRYMIDNSKELSILKKDFVYHYPNRLDIDKMIKVSKLLIGRRDFSVFAKDASRYETCVRTVKDISIRKKGRVISIDIEADGFLMYMARNIVAFLLKCAAENMTLKHAKDIIASKKDYSNNPVPAKGLYLMKVKYSSNNKI